MDVNTYDRVKETYVEVNNRTKKKTYRVIKRIIDIIAGIMGTLLLIPLTLFVYILHIKYKDRGQIFYIQYRIGKDGKLFKMYKYRTMMVNAEEKLKIYLSENEDAKKEYKKYKKLKKDPRITKIGKFLRDTSLDEFPQFINVLKGDMSLVGPRPYLASEKEEMNGFFKDIVSVKPGLTGFWQTNGRSEVTFNDRLEMDMDYCNSYSLKTDLKIILNTIKKVIKKEGAM